MTNYVNIFKTEKYVKHLFQNIKTLQGFQNLKAAPSLMTVAFSIQNDRGQQEYLKRRALQSRSKFPWTSGRPRPVSASLQATMVVAQEQFRTEEHGHLTPEVSTVRDTCTFSRCSADLGAPQALSLPVRSVSKCGKTNSVKLSISKAHASY